MSDAFHDAFAAAPERTLSSGTTLFHRGDQVRYVFHVREGRVALRRMLTDGGALTLHRARSGEIVAIASIWAEATHCDAVCETDTRLAVLSAAALRDWIGTSPAAAAFAQTAHTVQALRARVEVLRLRRLSDRLDAYLDLHGPPGTGGWVGVADWIGVTPSALYRELGRRRALQ